MALEPEAFGPQESIVRINMPAKELYVYALLVEFHSVHNEANIDSGILFRRGSLPNKEPLSTEVDFSGR